MERYIGIDLNDDFAMLSYYTKGMAEPVTYSRVTGLEAYAIPLCVAKRKGIGQWIMGEEAKNMPQKEQEIFVDHLLCRALADETIQAEGKTYALKDLLFLFLKKLLGIPLPIGEYRLEDILVITNETINLDTRKLFAEFAIKVGIEPENMLLLTYKESFYYYLFHQSKELMLHDGMLFYYTNDTVRCWHLNQNHKTTPKVVHIMETQLLLHQEQMVQEELDTKFAAFAKSQLEGKIISSVYLVGDQFDGQWMKQSLSVLCRGRRVFMGKNLFSKGACFGAFVWREPDDWKYLYINDQDIMTNVSLKVIHHGKEEFLTILEAGQNWYHASGECEVILEEGNTLEVWLQKATVRKAMVKTLELTDLPKRKRKLTRLHIKVAATSCETIEIVVEDMGFGGIVRPSGKYYKFDLTL